MIPTSKMLLSNGDRVGCATSHGLENSRQRTWTCNTTTTSARPLRMVVYCSARCLLRVVGSNRVLVNPQRLVSALSVRTVESRPLSRSSHLPAARPLRRYLSSSSIAMSSVDQVTQALATLSVKPTATISHAATNSPASWKDALSADPSSPKSFELIKTIVFKPKTAKNVTPVPVVVIAREETETASGALGKKLNLKELRLASEDLLSEFFALDKNSRTCFATISSLITYPNAISSI